MSRSCLLILSPESYCFARGDGLKGRRPAEDAAGLRWEGSHAVG